VNYTGTKLGGRFAYLWPIPGYFLSRRTSLPPAEQYLSPEVLDADNPREYRVLREVVTDLVRHKPLLILVQPNLFKAGTAPVPFNALEYLLQDKQFAEFFSNYRLWRRSLVKRDRTDIYRRIDP